MFPRGSTMSYCDYYGTCQPTIWNWVYNSPLLTIIAYVVILAIVLTLVFFTINLVRSRRQPLCVDCLEYGTRKHTPYHYSDLAVCEFHYREREMADETTYLCPKHNVAFKKRRREGVTIDVCPHGCIFLDDGELEDLEEVAKESGRSSGQMLGLAIGIAT